MTKYFFALVIIILIVSALEFKSYDLGDGYKLQGFRGHHRWIFKGLFAPIFFDEVMGVQGCKKGYLHGWTIDDPNEFFLINTNSNSLIWLSIDELNNQLMDKNCPRSDMNKEINLAGFANGYEFIRY